MLPSHESIRTCTGAVRLSGPSPRLEVPVSLFPTKFLEGGEDAPRCATAPLWFVLTENFDTDAHFAQYTSRREIRCRKGEKNTDLVFHFCAFDFDFADHATRPSEDDLTQFVTHNSFIIDHAPNIIYPTRGGARTIYLIEPLTDPDLFEAHRLALQHKLAEDTCRSRYKLDRTAKDWTRFFRAPSVVRDRKRHWNTPVYFCHDRLFVLTKLQAKTPPPRPKPTGRKKFTATDPYVAATLKHVGVGNRNGSLFRVACHVLEKYDEAGQENWIEILRDRFLAEGLEDREFEATINSARRTITTQREDQ